MWQHKRKEGVNRFKLKKFLNCWKAAMHQFKVDCGKSKMHVVISKVTAEWIKNSPTINMVGKNGY